MSNKYEQWVRDGQFVEARYAHGRQGMDVHARGKVVAYCDAPTVVIETDDGTRVHWRADLTHEAERPVCGVSEGMTGIDCGLPKGHVMPDGSLRTVHEGKTTPEQTAYVGYEMSVRWPLAGTLLPEQAEGSAGCQNQWPVETVTGEDIDRWRREEEAPEPRVFASDGPEPPPDVRAVTDGDEETAPYLVRFGDHWRWARGLDRPENFMYTGGTWDYVTGEMDTPVTFTEVV